MGFCSIENEKYLCLLQENPPTEDPEEVNKRG